MSTPPRVRRIPFGRTRGGEVVTRYELHGDDGMRVALLDYGAIVQELHVPDAAGALADVVLGYDDLAGYEDDPWYMGAVVGRTAGRIPAGVLAIEGEQFRLATNDGSSHLHGGAHGFSCRTWRGEVDEREGRLSVTFTRRSADGEEGYPGTLDARVTYSLTARTLAVSYHATTDRPTVANMTQHSYFNLAGEGTGSILDHAMQLHADRYVPLEPGLVPSGHALPVQGTVFDFRTPHRPGERIGRDEEQLVMARGYDHGFVVRGAGDVLAAAAHVTEPITRRTLEVWTTEPAVHLYTGNFLSAERTGKHGHRYDCHGGFCLETQQLPGAARRILHPGETLRSRTEFRFGIAS